jgi:uncharacterized protein
VRSRFIAFIAVFQSLLFLVHFFVYETWVSFQPAMPASEISVLRVAMAALSVSFVAATLLAWRYFNWLVRAFYKIAATWLGVVSLAVLAACLCWIALGVAHIADLHVPRNEIADAMFGLALLASLYGVINAAATRVTRVTVKLPGLPDAWRGRVAALVSDTHLGHVRNQSFLRRVVRTLNRLGPDIVLITGDMYDGTTAPLDRLAEPWKALAVPFGAYFITGNHEEFTDRNKYIAAVQGAGIRVLNNEKVDIEGLQLVGVHYREANDITQLRSILQGAALDRERASILLAHAPHNLGVAESYGISLQLSGHTHGGQYLPFTWITSRIYGRYVHGLQRMGEMMVFTSWGVGTWGPPMRLGTNPEIVLLRFE